MMEKFVNRDDILNKDNVIFHFTSTNVCLENILFDKKLKFSNFKNFTDVREGLFLTSGIAWGDDIEDMTKDYFKPFEKAIIEKKENYRVLCFCSNDQLIDDTYLSEYIIDKNYINDKIISFLSQSNNQNIDSKELNSLLNQCINQNNNNEKTILLLRGYQKDRMWDNYGDHYRGVCLAFDKDKLINAINNDNKNELVNCYHVNYCESPYEKYSQVCLDEKEENIIQRMIIDQTFRKHYDYKEENEFRILIKIKDENADKVDITESLVAVILGPSFPEVYENTIEEQINNINELKADNRNNKIRILKYVIDKTTGQDFINTTTPEGNNLL